MTEILVRVNFTVRLSFPKNLKMEELLGLTRFSANRLAVLASSLLWTLCFKYYYSKSVHFEKLQGEKRVNFKMHVISLMHALLVSALVPFIIFDPVHQADKIFGQSRFAESVASISLGYFIWDIVMCLKYHKLNGYAFLFHAVTGFFLTLGTFQPLFQYYLGVFLAFEISTVFLNVHWFCDKFDLSGSFFQLANGVCLLVAFFIVRICFGTFEIVQMISMGLKSSDKVSLGWLSFYTVASFLMQLLNYKWFFQIAKSVASRVKTEGKFKKTNQPASLESSKEQ